MPTFDAFGLEFFETDVKVNNQPSEVCAKERMVKVHLGPYFGKMRLDAITTLRTACKLAGIRVITFHTLRHTFAWHLVMRGVTLKRVQELLGHSTIEMTMR